MTPSDRLRELLGQLDNYVWWDECGCTGTRREPIVLCIFHQFTRETRTLVEGLAAERDAASNYAHMECDARFVAYEQEIARLRAGAAGTREA